MLDFNTADAQTSGSGPIPPESIVILNMTIRDPRSGKEGSHPLLCRAPSGNEYLDVEYKVHQGSFEGRTIWQNYTVAGSEKAAAISMRTLRAIVESARQIRSDDNSPQATQARVLQDWSDFQGMVFIAKVGAEVDNYKGEDRIVNTIKKVITPDMDEYAIVTQQGEVITNNQLPQVPATTVQQPAAGGSAPAWGKPQTPVQGQQGGMTSPSSPVPAWAKK